MHYRPAYQQQQLKFSQPCKGGQTLPLAPVSLGARCSSSFPRATALSFFASSVVRSRLSSRSVGHCPNSSCDPHWHNLHVSLYRGFRGPPLLSFSHKAPSFNLASRFVALFLKLPNSFATRQVNQFSNLACPGSRARGIAHADNAS